MLAGASSSPSESGTIRTEAFFETGFRDTGGRERRGGGGARRREVVIWESFSYSTDVLRGTAGLGRVTPEAQAVFGFGAGNMSLSAAMWRALARMTEVSLTVQLLGLGGAEMIFGPPGREVKASRCLILANLASAEELPLSSVRAWLVCGGDAGRRRGGERDSRVEAL